MPCRQVLAILDGTALSWPGVSQAVDDMEFLTDMCSQTTNKLEAGSRKLQVAAWAWGGVGGARRREGDQGCS